MLLVDTEKEVALMSADTMGSCQSLGIWEVALDQEAESVSGFSWLQVKSSNRGVY